MEYKLKDSASLSQETTNKDRSAIILERKNKTADSRVIYEEAEDLFVFKGALYQPKKRSRLHPDVSRETIVYLNKKTESTEISEGVTPEILVAWPRVSGFMFISLCLASDERPTTSSYLKEQGILFILRDLTFFI